MKALCFILSIYVIILASIPCCANDGCNDNIRTEQSTARHEEPKKDCDCKGCSPFIVCSCSSGFVFSYRNYIFLFSGAYLTIPTPHYKQSFIESYFAEIWQPPKIS